MPQTDENISRNQENFYQIAWAARAKVCRMLHEQGANDLATLLDQFNAFNKAHRIQMGGDLVDDPTTGAAHKVFNGRVDFIPRGVRVEPPSFPIRDFCNACFGDTTPGTPESIPHDMVPPAFVAGLLDDRFDAVVELGTGFGRRLFELHLMGEGRAPKLLAGEYTDAGRELGQWLADLEPGLDIRFFKFDHRHPDVAAFKGVKRLLIFSCHSIEQVSNIPEDYFDQLASCADEVVGVHFEPFGFQFGPRTPDDDRHEDFATRKGYNKNLFDVVDDADRRGVINIRWMAKNILSFQPKNPSSLVLWDNRSLGDG